MQDRAIDWGRARERMVRRQVAARSVRDPATLGAMWVVPRHEFVLPEYLDLAYEDRPLPSVSTRRSANLTS
ncbi:MAG: hypothetical protein P8Y29_01340 [Gemmatimonadota bacterium]